MTSLQYNTGHYCSCCYSRAGELTPSLSRSNDFENFVFSNGPHLRQGNRPFALQEGDGGREGWREGGREGGKEEGKKGEVMEGGMER